MLSKKLLLKVQRPARYTGNEWNSVKKNWHSAKVKLCICFPDIYEVGMSNLGFRIIYGVLNSRKDILCERAFCPWPDMELLLRQKKKSLYSLESKRPLADFDILGFSLNYELNYTNVLNMLDLSHIPKWSKERSKRHPLIIAGGGACFNPEPLADFFDCFLIGESENLILEIIDAYKKLKYPKRKTFLFDKKNLLDKIVRIPGVYIPSFYSVGYTKKGEIKSFRPRFKQIPSKIDKRTIPKLDLSFFPTNWLIPNIQIIHDRITVEIMRGCPNRCRFCQAQFIYRPYRIRSKEKIMKLCNLLYKNTGYENLSLLSLSSSDYPKIEDIASMLINRFKDKGVSVSLPSLKSKKIVANLTGIISQVKKTGITFAPEAGSRRLRKVLNKDIEEEVLFDTCKELFKLGYNNVKLYFMIGLPTETMEDIEAIVDLAKRLSKLRTQVSKRFGQIRLSIATFIPKTHTPFQWLPFADLDSIYKKQACLRQSLSGLKDIKLSFHDLNMSLLEAIISRGDRRLGYAIYLAWEKGRCFDAWSQSFDIAKWLDALKEAGLSAEFYLRKRKFSEILPWEHINAGLDKRWFWQEYQKALTPLEMRG